MNELLTYELSLIESGIFKITDDLGIDFKNLSEMTALIESVNGVKISFRDRIKKIISTVVNMIRRVIDHLDSLVTSTMLQTVIKYVTDNISTLSTFKLPMKKDGYGRTTTTVMESLTDKIKTLNNDPSTLVTKAINEVKDLPRYEIEKALENIMFNAGYDSLSKTSKVNSGDSYELSITKPLVEDMTRLITEGNKLLPKTKQIIRNLEMKSNIIEKYINDENQKDLVYAVNIVYNKVARLFREFSTDWTHILSVFIRVSKKLKSDNN